MNEWREEKEGGRHLHKSWGCAAATAAQHLLPLCRVISPLLLLASKRWHGWINSAGRRLYTTILNLPILHNCCCDAVVIGFIDWRLMVGSKERRRKFYACYVVNVWWIFNASNDWNCCCSYCCVCVYNIRVEFLSPSTTPVYTHTHTYLFTWESICQPINNGC